MKIEKEKRVIQQMILLYCKGKGHSEALCPDCRELLSYALERLTHCPFQDGKPACRRCPRHCYNKSMRRRIAEVMRYSGWRMLFLHPIMALRHIL